MMNKDLKDIFKNVVSSVLAWVIIGIIVFIPVLLTFFGFDWKVNFAIFWNYKVRIVYLFVALCLFGIYHFWRVLALKKLVTKNIDNNYYQKESDSEISPYGDIPVWNDIEKFPYNGVLWQICVLSMHKYQNKNEALQNCIIDDIKIKPEPLCPECETPLESTFIASGFGNTGKWKCLNEKCKFEKKAPSYFSEFKNKALKVWKSQNASNFQ